MGTGINLCHRQTIGVIMSFFYIVTAILYSVTGQDLEEGVVE